MLVSQDEFIKSQIEKSNMIGKTYLIAHHASNKTIVGTVTQQDNHSITLDGIGLPSNFKLYYNSYHVLEQLD